jgi:hypothetical protein
MGWEEGGRGERAGDAEGDGVVECQARSKGGKARTGWLDAIQDGIGSVSERIDAETQAFALQAGKRLA